MHVEVVPSVEADACVYGSNFVRAVGEMREWIEFWNQSDIEQSMSQKPIKWLFNPRGAPHFRGVPDEWSEAARKL